MPSTKKIQQTMTEQGFTDELLSQFDFTEPKGAPPEPILAIINRMDKLLTKEQGLAVMEKQGCCKGGQRDKHCKEFAKLHKGKTVAEKLAHMFEGEHMVTPKLNADGSFTITMEGY